MLGHKEYHHNLGGIINVDLCKVFRNLRRSPIILLTLPRTQYDRQRLIWNQEQHWDPFGMYHYEKYRSFTRFPGVEILWKGTISVEFLALRQNYAETVPFRKISTPGNQVKLRHFSQCSKTYSAIVENKRRMVYLLCLSTKNYFFSLLTRVRIEKLSFQLLANQHLVWFLKYYCHELQKIRMCHQRKSLVPINH